MTDTLRDRIVRVQAEHVEGQLTNYDTGRIECGCGHQGDATYREHLADAILAIPGIAVVELPEPDYDGDGGVGLGTGDNSVFASGGMVYDQYSQLDVLVVVIKPLSCGARVWIETDLEVEVQ